MPYVAFVVTVSHASSIPAPEAVLGCQQNIIVNYRLRFYCACVKRKPVVIYVYDCNVIKNWISRADITKYEKYGFSATSTLLR